MFANVFFCEFAIKVRKNARMTTQKVWNKINMGIRNESFMPISNSLCWVQKNAPKKLQAKNWNQKNKIEALYNVYGTGFNK